MTDFLKQMESVATVGIAFYVAFIGTLQWYIAKEKLRLDLYNRRFEVYTQAMTFMQESMDWGRLDENGRMQKRIPFIRSVRESRFLFAGQPEILSLLEELYNRSFEGVTAGAACDPDWLLAFNSKLEVLMLPFLAFGQRSTRTPKGAHADR